MFGSTAIGCFDPPDTMLDTEDPTSTGTVEATTTTGTPSPDDESSTGAGGNTTTSDGDTDASSDTTTGTGEPEDCNGDDPTGFADGVEVCDGIDQNCNEEIDEGVPNDGEGCMDPGPPTFGDTVDTIHITVHTDVEADAESGDSFEVCFPDLGLCQALDIEDWADRGRANYDVMTIDADGAAVADIQSMEFYLTSEGNDAWKPLGFQVSFDGNPVYCRDGLDIYFGNGEGELSAWADPDGFGNHCDTIWPTPITHGPMLGAMGPTDARIWYRTDHTRAVLLRVATSLVELQSAPVVDYGYPVIVNDFTETVHVGGLTPDTEYFYDIEIDGTRYGPWSFNTAPDVGESGTWSMAMGSSAGADDQPIWQGVRDVEPDVFLFLGDNHFAGSSNLTTLRQYYRYTRSRGLRSVLQHEASILSIWDDLDYTGSGEDGNATGKQFSLQAFSEYWANPSYGLAVTPGIFSMHSYRDVDIFMIDDRYYRGLDDSITGDAQEQWLLDALSASTATFKLIASGSQFSLDSTASQSWANFPTAQQRLLQHIADEVITGVVLLSGDIRRSEFRTLPAVKGGYPIPELTSSAMANSSIAACPPIGGELVNCFSGSNYFMNLEIDTSAVDPALVATVYDVDGTEVDSLTILRSNLE
ncbi:MAG: alkaline phosphatase D family protein [Myxococcota bacterium]